jgi:carbamoyltransferase
MTSSTILGLNCSHDAAACVAVDGRILCAISEERLSRRKHCAGWPALAVEYCMRELERRTDLLQPDLVVMNQLPPADNERLVSRRFPRLAPEALLVNPSHHFLHACYARMLAPDKPTVILVADGSGYSYAEHRARQSPFLGEEPRRHDMAEALSAYYVDAGGDVTMLIKDWGEWAHWLLRFPSIGHMYGVAAHHIFGGWEHAGKVMGLAPFGTPTGLGIGPIATQTLNSVRIDTDWIVDVPPIESSDHLEQQPLARDLAAKVQAELEAAMWHVVRRLFERTGCDTLCLTGGVALNSVFNGKLMRDGPFSHVFVTPAAHDSGTAIGAAAYGYRCQTGKVLAFGESDEFLGRCYSQAEIDSAIASCPDLAAESVTDPVEASAADLAAGRTIGWFEGGSEFGPRALGHRSLLADPRGPRTKDELNIRIKYRESFRPYAAAVLKERCSDWFEDDLDSPHMLAVSMIRSDHAQLVPAVVHVDGSCRLQTVDAQYVGSLRQVIEAFARRTGVPLLLNTSLNVHGEPISETPREALDCLLRSGLDILYCGQYRVTKRVASIMLGEDHRLVGVPAREFKLVVDYANVGGHICQTRSWAAQGGRHVQLTPLERSILLAGSDGTTVADVVSMFPDADPGEIRSGIQSLCDRGVLCLRLR